VFPEPAAIEYAPPPPEPPELDTAAVGPCPAPPPPPAEVIVVKPVPTIDELLPETAGTPYPLNTTSAAFTVTLPASPSVGDTIILVDYAGTFATNNITVNPNGLKIGSLNLFRSMYIYHHL